MKSKQISCCLPSVMVTKTTADLFWFHVATTVYSSSLIKLFGLMQELQILENMCENLPSLGEWSIDSFNSCVTLPAVSQDYSKTRARLSWDFVETPPERTLQRLILISFLLHIEIWWWSLIFISSWGQETIQIFKLWLQLLWEGEVD